MRMILSLASATLLLAPVAASAASPQQLENGIWQAFKDKNANAFKAMFTPNYVGIYDDGPATLAKELQAMKDTRLQSFAISGLTSRMIDPDDMLTTYAVDMKAAVGKRDASGRYWTTSLWHRSGNKWLTAYHSEIKAKK